LKILPENRSEVRNLAIFNTDYLSDYLQALPIVTSFGNTPPTKNNQKNIKTL
jgi:hypothetical protein